MSIDVSYNHVYLPQLFVAIRKLLSRKHHSRVWVDWQSKSHFHVHVVHPELIYLQLTVPPHSVRFTITSINVVYRRTLDEQYEWTMDQELWTSVTSNVRGGRLPALTRCTKTLQREITICPPSWKYDVISKIWLRQSMRIWWRTMVPNFIPGPIWNDKALGFLKGVTPPITTRRKITRVAMCRGPWDQFPIKKWPILHTVVYFANIIAFIAFMLRQKTESV